jgi:hypothetical protein
MFQTTAQTHMFNGRKALDTENIAKSTNHPAWKNGRLSVFDNPGNQTLGVRVPDFVGYNREMAGTFAKTSVTSRQGAIEHNNGN